MRIDGRFIRVAEELLIAQEPRWTSTEARGVVVRAFQSGGIEADASEVRACASSTFRVGCAIEQLDELAHLNPWPIETLQSEIDLRIAPWLSAELRKPFVDTLAAQVKNKEPFRPRLLDWTPEINRFLRLTSTPDFFPDLMAKIDLAQRLFQLIEERRDVLVRSVEQELETDRKTVAEAICEDMLGRLRRRQSDALDVRSDSAAPQKRGQTAESDDSRRSRAEETQLLMDELLCAVRFTQPSNSAEFCLWFDRLPATAQRAVTRRLTMLTTEPLVHRLWVKAIVHPKCNGIRELRVVSEGTHYRILFEGGLDAPPTLHAFGLRRDLPELVERVCDRN